MIKVTTETIQVSIDTMPISDSRLSFESAAASLISDPLTADWSSEYCENPEISEMISNPRIIHIKMMAFFALYSFGLKFFIEISVWFFFKRCLFFFKFSFTRDVIGEKFTFQRTGAFLLKIDIETHHNFLVGFRIFQFNSWSLFLHHKLFTD